MSNTERPKAGAVEKRHLDGVSVEGRKIHGLIPYGVESRDMGGWREVIEPGALDAAKLDDLVAVVDHAGVPLARYPTTLNLEDRSDGLHWSLTPPESRADVREAIERGDLKAGSWRMIVGKEEWRGDTRHVREIAELRDVSIATAPAYSSGTVEYRSAPTTTPEDAPEKEVPLMSEEKNTEVPVEETRAEEQTIEERRDPAGSLQVEERTGPPVMRSLAEEFRSRGFPGDAASMDWSEFRAVTYGGGTVTDLAQVRREGVPLGYDQRWAHPAFPSVGVGSDVTSVQTFRQSSRTLLAGTAVVRAIDETDPKPEVDTAAELVTLPLNQVAAIESDIPNILLETDAIGSLIETDLRLQLFEGFDSLVDTAVAQADNQAPGDDELLVSIRKAAGTIEASGYSPNTLILDPASAITLDTLTTAGTATPNDYVYGAGVAATGPFGLNVRVSKSVSAPVVADANAFGRLYIAPLRLQRFEENDGSTNTSLVRLETNAAFSAERLDAAIRVAAS